MVNGGTKCDTVLFDYKIKKSIVILKFVLNHNASFWSLSSYFCFQLSKILYLSITDFVFSYNSRFCTIFLGAFVLKQVCYIFLDYDSRYEVAEERPHEEIPHKELRIKNSESSRDWDVNKKVSRKWEIWKCKTWNLNINNKNLCLLAII